MVARHARGAIFVPQLVSIALGQWRSEVVFDESLVPRVDLSQPHAAVAESLRHAVDADGPGFFYLVNHGIAPAIFDEVIREAHRFYRLPARRKLEISAVGYGGGEKPTKGYVPPRVKGAYAKDSSDVRPGQEKASVKLNTRETLSFRFPEEETVKEDMYYADYNRFLTELDDKANRAATWIASDSGSNSSSGSSSSGSGTTDASAELRHPHNRPVPTSKVAAAARRFFLPNQWPNQEEFPQFRAAVERYFDEMTNLANTMFKLFSEFVELHTNAGSGSSSLGSADGGMAPQALNSSAELMPHDKGMVTFNLVRYPPSKAEEHEFGIADHTDWELFTLLYPVYLHSNHVDSCGAQHGGVGDYSDCSWNDRNPNIDPNTGVAFTGLEVWFQDRWMAVPHLPGAIIVNQGEMLFRMSQGRAKAPVHRVLAKNDFERYSLISFWAPNYDMLLPDPDLPYGRVPAGEHYLKRTGFIG
eukprot:TRINITY_DN9875_c2_g1_i1.p1 TRINITY_DN9875_c2_g1~~TRINITY_DN9875_c2_g1_i1.p1  ORF type:complete len:472 (+),score=77.18 TRINITY_DN9875_c2_g1_i1:74-1489(+)